MINSAELAPDYYLTNFCTLVEFVVARYQALLSEEEYQFYQCFQLLGVDSQKLYVRLLSRKGVSSSAGALFRQSKLKYVEIEDPPTAVKELQAVGLLQCNPRVPRRELLPLFTKSELLSASASPVPKTLKRTDLEDILLGQAEDIERGNDSLWVGEIILAVKFACCFETFKLLFFGNLNQDLTDFVLRDLGLYRYESYSLDHQNLPFHNREQIDQYLDYYRCFEQVEVALAAGPDEILALAERMPSGIQGDATLRRRLDRLRLKLARQLERLDHLETADQLYQKCEHPPARERRARIAVKRGNTSKGLSICRQILDSPFDESERIFAESFGYRIAKREECTQEWPKPERYCPPTKTITLPQGPQRVELQVASHLQSAEAGICYYVENCLVNGALGLYVWDILFAPVPGAFFNPFQVAPGDFRTPDFLPSRRIQFEQRLAELDQDLLKGRVWRNFREKKGIANPLVAWDLLTEELLALALERIPPDHWRTLFQHVLSDINHNRCGLPDLILFPSTGGYELVEVKGPGDRLQQNQQRWLAFFAAQQVPHRVIYVEWQQP
ncbi:VRR-NUC domain-containing protein [Microbulbifer epialgicus]|uniref:phosphodiesterase I n=1 Tax=Microbulbifer epialgicus TaxID=393907 RepID=A0ABV4NYK1_9GAMM